MNEAECCHKCNKPLGPVKYYDQQSRPTCPTSCKEVELSPFPHANTRGQGQAKIIAFPQHHPLPVAL